MNTVSTDQRKYTLRARAERQAETRRRIVEATVALHQDVGPARTTIADIARRAGVERLTVYRNFPRPADLLAACQRHFLAQAPPPDILPPVPLADALRALYSWFRKTREMEHHVHHDRHLVPELDDLMDRGADRVFDGAAAAHAAGDERAERLIRVALEFTTWELLADRGATDAEIAHLFAEAVRGPAPARSAAAGPRSSPRRSR
jgi:AcrR family transcriptional regulator